MIDKINLLKKYLQENNFSMLPEIGSSLLSIAPVFDSDIESIRKAINNKDFGNCEFMVNVLLQKWSAFEKKSSLVSPLTGKYSLNQIIDIGGIGAIENMGITPANENEWAEYHYNEAKMYKKIKQWDKVEVSLKKSLTFKKTHFDSVNMLVNLYKRFGEIEKSLDVINDFLPQYSECEKNILLYYKADLELLRNNSDESLKIINEVIDYYKDNYEAYLLRATIYSLKNKFELAMQDFNIVQNNKPEIIYKSPSSLSNLAACDTSLNNCQKIDLLKKSINLLPNWEFSNYNLGSLLIKENEYEKALKHFLIAHKQNVQDIDYIEQIVNCLYKLEQTDKLKEYLVKGIKLGSENCKYNYEKLSN